MWAIDNMLLGVFANEHAVYVLCTIKSTHSTAINNHIQLHAPLHIALRAAHSVTGRRLTTLQQNVVSWHHWPPANANHAI